MAAFSSNHITRQELSNYYNIRVSSEELQRSSHDARLTVYENRYSQQVEAVTTDLIPKNWT